MAGSGKTTLLQRIASHLQEAGDAGYILNLDPAVADVPYGANVDIRDTVSAACGAPLPEHAGLRLVCCNVTRQCAVHGHR